MCRSIKKRNIKKIPYIVYLRMRKLVRNIAYQSTSEEETAAIKQYLKAKNNRIYFLTNIPSIPKKEYVRAVKKKERENLYFFLGYILKRI